MNLKLAIACHESGVVAEHLLAIASWGILPNPDSVCAVPFQTLSYSPIAIPKALCMNLGLFIKPLVATKNTLELSRAI